MVRPKSQLWKHFIDPGDKSAICKYCEHTFKKAHVLKMARHLLNCVRCPDLIKEDMKKSNTIVAPQKENIPPNVSPPPNDNSLTNEQKSEIHALLAKAIYVSGTPLSIVEHPLWQQLFHKLQPLYKLPSRKAISTTYLQDLYKKMNDDIASEIKALNYVHLQLDGWTDINNAGIINFMICKPEPVFIKSVNTGENRHTSEYLKDEILKVMSQFDAKKFVVLIGDNARNVQRAFQLVKEDHPHITPLNCAAHTLNLLCQDIMQPDCLKMFSDMAIDVVKTIKRSQILTALLNRMIKELKKGETLKLPAKTRWSSRYACFKSLENTKAALQRLALDDNANGILPMETKAALLDDNFWKMNFELMKITEPISEVITKLQSNKCHLINVFILMKDLKSKFNFILPDINMLTDEDRVTIITAVDNRISMCLKPIHFAAHLLDPKSLGCELSEYEEIAALEYVNDMSEHLGINAMANLSNFKSKEGILWGKNFVWNNVNNMSAIDWWKGICSSSSLSKIACRVLTAPSTSAAVERSFSTYGNILTKKRNRLLSERASKLAFIAYNWNLENSEKNQSDDESSFEYELCEPSTSSGNRFEFINCNDSSSESD